MYLATQKGIFRLELHTRHKTKLKGFRQRGVNALSSQIRPLYGRNDRDHGKEGPTNSVALVSTPHLTGMITTRHTFQAYIHRILASAWSR